MVIKCLSATNPPPPPKKKNFYSFQLKKFPRLLIIVKSNGWESAQYKLLNSWATIILYTNGKLQVQD